MIVFFTTFRSENVYLFPCPLLPGEKGVKNEINCFKVPPSWGRDLGRG